MGASCSLCFSVVCGVDYSRILPVLVLKCGRPFQEIITAHATASLQGRYKKDVRYFQTNATVIYKLVNANK